jgi:pimeloyl-ACP methyl ester carboxylesterase
MSALAGQKLLFLPALDGTGLSFEPLRPYLPAGLGVQVVTYPPRRCLDFEQTVQWAADQIAADEPPIVLAESFSGPVAIALIGSGRLRARCLILCATFARSPRPRLLALARLLPTATLLRLPFPQFLFKHIVAGGPDAATLLADLWRHIRPIVSPAVLARRLELIRRIDVRPWLPRLTMPCLYIQATGDRTVPPQALQDFTATLPHIEVVRIPGPHFILQAQPQACLTAIVDFVSRITSTADHSLD